MGAMRPLLLVSGSGSTRTGTPKHLLGMFDGAPLYRSQLEVLRQVFPEPQTIYMFLPPDAETDAYLDSLPSGSGDTDRTPESSQPDADEKQTSVKLLRHITPSKPGHPPAGPATQGLLAAYKYDPWANWVVVGCNYPLLPPDAVLHLVANRDAAPVTCFRLFEGVGGYEPLLGIWAPAALSRLAERFARGHPCPREAARELDGLVIDAPPGCEWWLAESGTVEDFVAVVEEEKKLGSGLELAVELTREAA
ncbi:molybdopterin-guanine dinucleotide biosynthesis protein a [Colletotrichum musicola]|uniref:Molybdopterin-guanine dinucleotide biosynthesis protein a n=1 Tax=Colletotrichum musicola TaxID=2175873 RepID=A0A8H6N0U6_9PEZI|nr:molybdopterin-guanine dinucleotide biosynthesis protein a [Colletotrichum musicola]